MYFNTLKLAEYCVGARITEYAQEIVRFTEERFVRQETNKIHQYHNQYYHGRIDNQHQWKCEAGDKNALRVTYKGNCDIILHLHLFVLDEGENQYRDRDEYRYNISSNENSCGDGVH